MQFAGYGETNRRFALRLIYDKLKCIGIYGNGKHNLVYDSKVIFSYDKCRQIYYKSDICKYYDNLDNQINHDPLSDIPKTASALASSDVYDPIENFSSIFAPPDGSTGNIWP